MIMLSAAARVFAGPAAVDPGPSAPVVLASAVVAALCTVSTAHAASPAGSAGNGTTASAKMAASDAPCNFQGDQTCQSTDPAVTVSTYQTGDTSSCTFVWNIDWGDGQSTPDLVVTGPPSGWAVLASHTYAATGTYTISLTGEVADGVCTLTPFSRTFTLLAPPPPSRSGEACVFSAPNGGQPLPTFHGWVMSGHVGWAYLADPATGTWEYGANEGYTHFYGDSSRTWLAEGSWENVISAFKNALPGGKGKNKNFSKCSQRMEHPLVNTPTY